MKQYIDKDVLVAEIDEKLQDLIVCKKDAVYAEERVILRAKIGMCKEILSFLDTIKVKENDETAEAFARIIRANLTGIDKDVQYKFEQLYKEITGEKMYQGYND